MISLLKFNITPIRLLTVNFNRQTHIVEIPTNTRAYSYRLKIEKIGNTIGSSIVNMFTTINRDINVYNDNRILDLI